MRLFIASCVGRNCRAAAASAATIAVVTVIITSLSLTGCSKSTQPKEPKYNIYHGASYSKNSDGQRSLFSLLYVYDADSLTRLDSIPLPGWARELAVSPDGQWLYASVRYTTDLGITWYLVKINARSRETAWTVDGTGPSVALLKNGALLVNERRVVRTTDGKLVRQYGDTLDMGGGPVSGARIALVHRGAVRIADVETGEVFGDYVPNDGTSGMCPAWYATLHPDGVHALVGGGSCLAFGNVLTGETIFGHPTEAFGDGHRLLVSEDGKFGLYTHPGLGPLEPVPDGIDVIDIAEQRYLKRLDLRSGFPVEASGRVCFVPGRRTFVAGPDIFSGGPLCLVDLNSLTVVKSISEVGTSRGCLGVGPRPTGGQ